MTSLSHTDSVIYNNPDAVSTIFTPAELAEYLNVGRNRAYDLLRLGEIKGFRIGNSWRVSKAAVDQYILEKSRL